MRVIEDLWDRLIDSAEACKRHAAVRCRDIKREIRPTGDYTEDRVDEMASRIVELAGRRGAR